MMTLSKTGFIVRIACLLAVLVLFVCHRNVCAIPVLSSGSTEVTFDTLDSGGNPAPGNSGGTSHVIYSLGEPGGINRLTGGTFELLAGYYGQDLLPPNTINNFLCSLNAYDGTVGLSWSSAGDDLSEGQLLPGSRVYIASTTVESEALSEAYWYNRRNTDAVEVKLSTGPIDPGTACSVQLDGLKEGVTYYFRIWTLDQAANWSELSNGTSAQFFFAPGKILNLAAVPGQYGRSIQLTWSAPGKDGYTGTLPAGSRYAIQRSSWTGVTYSTSSVDTVYISTSGVNPGEAQYYTLRSLVPGDTYYIRMWTADENPIWSDISNSTETWANTVLLSVTIPVDTYDYGQLATNISSVTANAFEVVNSGNVPENYTISCLDSLNWTLGTSPGNDIFALQAGFHASRPALESFNDNHFVTKSDILCSNTSYTIDASQLGIDIDPFTNSTRNLWFKLSTPRATSTPDQQQIQFTITAQEASE